MDEAIAKLGHGRGQLRHLIPTPDRMARLVFGKVMQPLNHDYLPNLDNMWPAYKSPFYDQEARGPRCPIPVYTAASGTLRSKVATEPVRAREPLRDLVGRGECGARPTSSTTAASRPRSCC